MQNLNALKAIKYLALFRIGMLAAQEWQFNQPVTMGSWVFTILIFFVSRHLVIKEATRLFNQYQENNGK